MSDPLARRLYVAEPAPRFGVPRPAVVDASVVAALLFAEPEQAQATQMMTNCRPVAPDLLPYEIANVAVNKRRQGLAPHVLDTQLADLEALGIELVAPDLPLVLDLSVRYRLTAYDASYLALAGTLHCPLATFDHRLAEAAHRYLGQADPTP